MKSLPVNPNFSKTFFSLLMPFVLCFLLLLFWDVRVALLRCKSSHDWMVCPQKLYPHPKSQGTWSKSQLVETDSLPSIFVSVALFAAVQRPGRTFHPFPASPIPYFVKLLRFCTRMHKNFLHRHPVSTWISLYKWPVRMLNVGKAFASLVFCFFFFRGEGKDIFSFIEANLMNKTVLYVKVYNVQIWCASTLWKDWPHQDS